MHSEKDVILAVFRWKQKIIDTKIDHLLVVSLMEFPYANH